MDRALSYKTLSWAPVTRGPMIITAVYVIWLVHLTFQLTLTSFKKLENCLPQSRLFHNCSFEFTSLNFTESLFLSGSVLNRWTTSENGTLRVPDEKLTSRMTDYIGLPVGLWWGATG